MSYNFIIDTDVGCDDACAIAYALNSPDVNVAAITTCFGNVSARQSMLNVFTLCFLFNQRHIKIYNGAAKPLEGETKAEQWPGHGPRGSGHHEFEDDLLSAYRHYEATVDCLPHLKILDAKELPEDTDLSVYNVDISMTAAEALVHMVREKPNFYTIVALGPLTNLALALRIDPLFLVNCKQVVWMGGSLGPGNSTAYAEFNAHADPLAANIVFNAKYSTPIRCVGWDVCIKHGLYWSEFDKLTEKSVCLQWSNNSNKNEIPAYIFPYIIAKFCSAYDTFSRPSSDQPDQPTFICCDLYAMIVAIHPEVITGIVSKHFDIGLDGEYIGAVIERDSDTTQKMIEQQHVPIEFVDSIDHDKFLYLFTHHASK